MILELGLRFRPLGSENQEEYAAAVTLLAQDVADLPADHLQVAIEEWIRTKRFLPRASELIDLARQSQAARTSGTDAAARQLQAHCDRLNAMQNGMRWRVVGEALNRRIDRAL